MTIKETWTDPTAIKGSEQVLQDSKYKVNMARHIHYLDSED